VAARLAEVGCLPLPVVVRQKIDEVFAERLAKAEIELAKELFDKPSVTRIFHEVMSPRLNTETGGGPQ
jgi:hypothetical protein